MRKIIHIDMDCFYAAIEMRDNAQYRHIPIAVGGSAEKRGVVATANYIARQYGIKSAMPMSQALKLCPNLKVVTPRMNIYKDVSIQLGKIFSKYTPKIEFLSLDEAYLDVSDCPLCHGSSTYIAKQIREDIQSQLNLTASAGVAPLKFLAKIASEINKPNGQYVITPENVDTFLETLSLNKITGIGKVSYEKLQQLGMYTCKDVKEKPLSFLLQHFGKLGAVLYERCQGIDSRDVISQRQRKSLGVEQTLAVDIYHWSECVEIVEQLYDEMVTRLQRIRPDLTISRQGVKFKFNDFQLTTVEHVWPKLCHSDFVSLAQEIWNERRRERGVRLIGLHVSLIDPQLDKQLSLPFALNEED